MGDFQIAIEGEIRKCTVEELRTIGTGVNVDAAQVGADRSKAQVMRAITEALDGLPDESQRRTLVMRMLPHAPEHVQVALMSILSGKPAASVKSEENEPLQDTLKLLQGMGFGSSTTSKFRKECKIEGKIGGTSEDSLNYISLCRQINDWKKKSYGDDEISMAVRKAVSTGSDLRTYLDAKGDIELDAMLSFIRTALREKSSSELHKVLNDDFQKDDEEPQTFVVRVMKLRETILQLLSAEGSQRFDAQGVRDLFLHTVRTGLKDDTIKSYVEPLVRRGATTQDQELIDELNVITEEEEARKKKRSVGKDKTKEKVCVAVSETAVSETIANQFLDAINKLQQTNKELKDDVTGLREEVNNLKNLQNRPVQKWGCDHCAKNGKGNSCRHCFRCGAGDHKKMDCPKPPLNA